MARRSDVGTAFRQAIELDGLGRQTLTTGAFQSKLDEVNQVWTLQECNRWIKYYQPDFMELITDNPHNRTWSLRNMGYVR